MPYLFTALLMASPTFCDHGPHCEEELHSWTMIRFLRSIPIWRPEFPASSGYFWFRETVHMYGVREVVSDLPEQMKISPRIVVNEIE